MEDRGLGRVALQTSLMDGKVDYMDYKSFMLFFMAHILQLALKSSVSSDITFVMTAKMSRRLQKFTQEISSLG